MKFPTHLERLIEALRVLPGVGPKSAQRMAHHLLQSDRAGAERLGEAISAALNGVFRCQLCNGFSEGPICDLCNAPQRDRGQLCVVETPADQLSVEQTLAFKGLYFILMGRISPLDGVGPREIGLEALVKRASDGLVKEVILATNFTNEGEATAFYLGDVLRSRGLSVTRLARGVPIGGELEFVDIGTIAQALYDRKPT